MTTLNQTVESSLLYKAGENQLAFVHDTYKDFMLARYFSSKFKAKGISPFVDELKGRLDQNQGQEKSRAELFSKFVSLKQMFLFYVGITEDVGLVEDFAGMAYEAREYNSRRFNSFWQYGDLMNLGSECIIELGYNPMTAENKDKFVKNLINLIDVASSPIDYNTDRIEGAINCLVLLGLKSEFVVDLLIGDAIRYSNTAPKDDGSPCNPNSFDILAILAKDSKKAREFLRYFYESNSWVFGRTNRGWSSELLSGVYRK